MEAQTLFGMFRFKTAGINGGHFLLDHPSKPALRYNSGHQAWYQDGKRHRVGAPAVIYRDGRKKWYQQGKLHNESGPAVLYPSGARVYALKGKFHNTNGPAIVTAGGVCYWFVNGKRMTKEEFDQRLTSLLV